MKIINALGILIKVLLSIPFMIVAYISQAIVNLLIRDAMERWLMNHLGVDVSKFRNVDEAKRQIELALMRKQQNERNEEE